MLVKLGMAEKRARVCARMFADVTRDGVYTHGINRFPRFVVMIESGAIDVNGEPKRVAGFGGLERWDGMRGPGNLNALAAMERAIELGRAHGIGCVALNNTNHWMRAGSYGWQAANAGMIGICWTNTMPNLPPWGGVEPVVGNNPIVFAVPRAKGHVVLDMAMSQFSYGTLAAYRKRGELLPVDGGFDEAGNLTRDPGAIEKSWRPLPIGYWKGSGFSMVLDMITAMMALSRATNELPMDPLVEVGIGQMFVTMNPEAFGPSPRAAEIADEVVASVQAAKPVKDGSKVRYAGEKVLRVREENDKLGLPVEETTWEKILAM